MLDVWAQIDRIWANPGHMLTEVLFGFGPRWLARKKTRLREAAGFEK